MDGSADAGATVTYRIRGTSTTAAAASVAVRSGSLSLAVKDSITGQELAVAAADVRGTTTASGETAPFYSESGRTLLLAVTATGTGTASYRLQVYPTSSGPETRTPVFAIGDTVNETVDFARDLDIFTFETSTAGQEVLVSTFLRDNTENSTVVIYAEGVAQPLYSGYLTFTSNGTLESQTSDPVVLPVVGRYHVVFESNRYPSFHIVARYQFQLRLLDRRPEGRPAAVAAGDTIDEAIGGVGDIDTYDLTVAAGTEIKLFFQSRGSSGQLNLRLQGPGIVTRDLSILPADTARFTRYTPRVLLAAAGPYTLTVSGPSRGNYRVWVFRIDRQPETAAATIAPGDTTVPETLAVPGDIDEYRFTLGTPTYVNVALFRAGPGTAPFRIEIRTSPGDSLVAGTTLAYLVPPDRVGVGARRLPSGTYILRVTGDVDDGNPYTGAYRVHLAAIDPLPEGRTPALSVGDSVSEALTVGDIDQYTFSGVAGQLYDVWFGVRPGGGTSGELGLRVFRQGTSGWIASATRPANGSVSAAARTYRFELPATGTYVIEVVPTVLGVDLDEYGPYWLALHPYSSLPEHVPVAVTVGDSIVAERLDELGDVDAFSVTGTPGQEIQILRWEIEVSAEAAIEGDSTRHIGGYSDHMMGLGRMRFPPSGTVALRFLDWRPGVYTSFYYQNYRYVGPYAFQVVAIDRAPEGRSAAFALGDSVSGVILPIGDVDEYTFTATAGDSLLATLALRPWGDVRLFVLSPDGSQLATVTAACSSCGATSASTALVIPATGTYTVRTQGGSDRVGTPYYGFRLTRR